jgi:hypothetical protein
VKDVRAANGTESKPKLRTLVARTNEFGRDSGDCVRRAKGGDRGEHTACSLLTREAMAHANGDRLTLHGDLQLAATA